MSATSRKMTITIRVCKYASRGSTRGQTTPSHIMVFLSQGFLLYIWAQLPARARAKSVPFMHGFILIDLVGKGALSIMIIEIYIWLNGSFG